MFVVIQAHYLNDNYKVHETKFDLALSMTLDPVLTLTSVWPCITMEMLFADKQKDRQNKHNQFSPSLIDFRITIIDHHKIIKKSVQQIHLLIK